MLRKLSKGKTIIGYTDKDQKKKKKPPKNPHLVLHNFCSPNWQIPIRKRWAVNSDRTPVRMLPGEHIQAKLAE